MANQVIESYTIQENNTIGSLPLAKSNPAQNSREILQELTLLTTLRKPVEGAHGAMKDQNSADELLLKVTPVLTSIQLAFAPAQGKEAEGKETSALPLFPKGMDPQTQKDFMAWLEAMEELEEIRKKLLALLAQLKSGKVKNVSWAIQKVMGLMMDFGGAQVKALAAVDNVETDLRNLLGKAQSHYNAAAGETGKGTGDDINKAKGEMEKFLKAIKQLEADLKFFQEYDKTAPKGKKIFDSATLKDIQDAIDSIKSQFGKSWGNASDMAYQLWLWQWPNGSNSGKDFVPQMKAITDAFSQINQTVSALSTTTNTRLQYKAEQLKQFQAIDESMIESYLKTLSTMIQNQKS